METENAKAVLSKICKEHDHDLTDDELAEALEALELIDRDDFYFDLERSSYRIIDEDAIWDIYVDGIKNMVEDTYNINLDKVPDFIAVTIDWEQTANNFYAGGGYGETFSRYDGSEIYAGGYLIFRIG